MTKHDRYNQSEKGRARRRRYEQSEKGRASRRRYNDSEARRASWRRYYDRRMDDPIFRATEGMRKRRSAALQRRDARVADSFVPNAAIHAALDRAIDLEAMLALLKPAS